MARPSLLARALVGYGVYLPQHPKKWVLHERLRNLLRARVEGEHEVVRAGTRWALTPTDYCASSLYWLGLKDPWEIQNLVRLLPADSLILDVGANFGFYSIQLAAGLGPLARIHAIEPCPANYLRITRNVELNGMSAQIQMHPLGVSDQPGTALLAEDPGNTGHAIISQTGGIPVELTTIDVFCEKYAFTRLDAMIVDVEGYEPKALKGAEQTIRRFKPLIFVELWPPVMARQGTTVQAVADFLEAQGYLLFKAQRGTIVPLRELPTGDLGVNAFAIHRDRLPNELRTASTHP